MMMDSKDQMKALHSPFASLLFLPFSSISLPTFSIVSFFFSLIPSSSSIFSVSFPLLLSSGYLSFCYSVSSSLFLSLLPLLLFYFLLPCCTDPASFPPTYFLTAKGIDIRYVDNEKDIYLSLSSYTTLSFFSLSPSIYARVVPS